MKDVSSIMYTPMAAKTMPSVMAETIIRYLIDRV